MTTTDKRKGVAVLAEVVAVLARYPGMRVSPVVDREDGVVALHVCIDADGLDGLQVLALHDELKYVADVAQVRAIAARYDIDAAKLEALLPAMHDDAPPQAVRHLTVQEIDAVVKLLSGEQLLPGEPADDLLESALPKLVALARAMEGAI